ncbi:Cell division protein FtsK [hydrothermal vent metagenome]|uniref:Cell division protein FtsK n=1 Tax=hydrothermal vent metagenome TaxID=652676 RepID=A0A1W1CST7_9ZZZZ
MQNPRIKKQSSSLEKKHLSLGVFSFFLIVFSSFLLVSIVSYSNSDAIWSQSSNADLVENYGGVLGAWLSDLLFKFFGNAIYVLPIAVAWLGWNIYTYTNNEKEFHGILFSLRIFSFLILLIFLSAFFAQNINTNIGGGWVGTSIHHLFFNLIKEFSLILYLSIIIISFSFSSCISIFTILDSTGSLIINIFNYLHNMLILKKQHNLEKKQAKQTKLHRESLYKTSTISSPKIKKSNFVVPSLKAQKPVQSSFLKNDTNQLPALSLLDDIITQETGYSEETLQTLSRQVELKLQDFGLMVEVENVTPGPVVTQFEISLAPGVKISQINNLSKDLARALLVESVRIVDVIPGKPVVGIEIPNVTKEMISLKELLTSEKFEQSKSELTIALGKDVNGSPVIENLAKMPHLLVAGATGMGKSVGLNAIILSVLYKSTPEQVRMIMIDPKVVELTSYVDTPHLLSPVITDMEQAATALRWCVNEMERRYQLLAKFAVRNLDGFNKKILAAQKQGEPLLDPFFNPENAQVGEKAKELEPLPLIMIVIDEYADMLGALAQDDRTKAKKVEGLIIRLAQKARAAGMHLIIATQRPSVDVITGLIKSNIPSRIAFKVVSKIDSRTILDRGGAEELLGRGDMLYTTPGLATPIRIHGAFVSDEEVERVINFLKEQSEPDYLDEVLTPTSDNIGGNGEFNSDDLDELYDEAVKIVTQTRRASISSIQRQLRIGYNRAARIVEDMEAEGVVSEVGSNGQRDVLAPPPIDI